MDWMSKQVIRLESRIISELIEIVAFRPSLFYLLFYLITYILWIFKEKILES